MFSRSRLPADVAERLEKPMRDLQYMIDVMTAARDGKKIQWRDHNAAGTYPWADSKKLSWDWTLFDYRIAPEPRKPKEYWLAIRPDGSVYETLPGCPFPAIHVREVLPEDK